MTAPFVLIDNLDSESHHFRVYEPAENNSATWLDPIVEEYVKLLTHRETPLKSLPLDTHGSVMDMTNIQKYLQKASIPRYKKGNFNVVRSDFGEILCYMLLEKEYRTLFGVKNIFQRELRDSTGRGIDAIGVEIGELLTLVLCEVKVSDEQPSPPRVVDANDDCLRKQHQYHLANLGEATKDKIWRAANHARDEAIADLLTTAAIYLEMGMLEKIHVIICSLLVRPKSKYTPDDFGSFRNQPTLYTPASIRFIVACIPDNVDVIVKKWYDMIQYTEGSR
jgi:hypothetical protein